MQQSQQTFLNSQKTKKNHSRKQLLQWLAHQGSLSDKNLAPHFNQVSLKNGIFYLSILQRAFPSETQSIKSKIKEKPVTEYDFEKNLVLAKKIIDKYSLPFPFEVNDIIKNKSTFEFLNFLKNLNDGHIKPSNEQEKRISNEKASSPEKKFMGASGYKTNREGSSSKNSQKPMSQAKSSRNYSASKNENPFYKIKSGKNLVEVGNNELAVLENNRSHVVAQNKLKKSTYMSEFDSLDDCNEALYELALEENIETFKKMLRKVKANIYEMEEGQNFEEFLEKINEAIFSRNK